MSIIDHDGRGVFEGLPPRFEATRYHSLAAMYVPEILEITATSEDGVIQGVRHRDLPIEGVQFHPESIMTVAGKDLREAKLRYQALITIDNVSLIYTTFVNQLS